MVNCISQPIKLDDLILITEPRSLTEMGDVSEFVRLFLRTIPFLERSLGTSGASYDTRRTSNALRRKHLSTEQTLRAYGLHA
jgi:hypothetical protein